MSGVDTSWRDDPDRLVRDIDEAMEEIREEYSREGFLL